MRDDDGLDYCIAGSCDVFPQFNILPNLKAETSGSADGFRCELLEKQKSEWFSLVVLAYVEGKYRIVIF